MTRRTKIGTKAKKSKHAADADTDPPRCYREAQFDAAGHLLPNSRAELIAVAEIRAQMAHDDDDTLLAAYQRPTTKWPAGKEITVEERVALATGQTVDRIVEHALTVNRGAANIDTTTWPIQVQIALLVAGLMDARPSDVTRAALATFHPMGLFSLLALDPPVFEAGRRRSTTPKLEERQFRQYLELLPVLRELGARVIDVCILETVLTRLQQLLEARVIASLTAVNKERRAARRAFDMTALRETGWSTSAVGCRRAKLEKLVGGLRTAEPDSWPISRIAALLIQSESDWSVAPSPVLVDRYRGRQSALEDLIKKDLARCKRLHASFVE